MSHYFNKKTKVLKFKKTHIDRKHESTQVSDDFNVYLYNKLSVDGLRNLIVKYIKFIYSIDVTQHVSNCFLGITDWDMMLYKYDDFNDLRETIYRLRAVICHLIGYNDKYYPVHTDNVKYIQDWMYDVRSGKYKNKNRERIDVNPPIPMYSWQE